MLYLNIRKEASLYKATFKNIDYPKGCDYEEYFKTKAAAIDYVEARSNEYKVKPQWRKGSYGLYNFSAESDKPDYFCGTYFGCVEELEVK
jgi:hypothetical protein